MDVPRFPIHVRGLVQFGDDLLRVRGHLSDCFLAIKMLAAGQEPDFGGFKVFDEPSLITFVSLSVSFWKQSGSNALNIDIGT
jgi:hypothetical protein